MRQRSDSCAGEDTEDEREAADVIKKRSSKPKKSGASLKAERTLEAVARRFSFDDEPLLGVNVNTAVEELVVDDRRAKIRSHDFLLIRGVLEKLIDKVSGHQDQDNLLHELHKRHQTAQRRCDALEKQLVAARESASKRLSVRDAAVDDLQKEIAALKREHEMTAADLRATTKQLNDVQQMRSRASR